MQIDTIFIVVSLFTNLGLLGVDPGELLDFADLRNVFCGYSLQLGNPFSRLGNRNMRGNRFFLPCHSMKGENPVVECRVEL